MGYLDNQEYKQLILNLETAQNHFNNAHGDREVTKAIHEMILAEVSIDNFIYRAGHPLLRVTN